MAKDVISLITTDHRRMESLFERLKREPENRQNLLPELAAEFIAHSRGEEDRVYPEIVKTAPGEREEVHHGAEEHHQAEEILHRLEGIDPGDDRFLMVLEQLEDAVTHHVQEEENDILPALAEAVGKKRLAELGQMFTERKERELRSLGVTVKGGSARRGGGADLSKDELYRKAQQADIPGRSRMSKDELAKALDKTRK